MRWIIGVLINAILFIAMAGFFDDAFRISGFSTAIIASVVLSVLNVLVRPILIILTLPVTVITLGLFLFVINAITLMLTDSIMGTSFDIDGFGLAFLVAIIMSLANVVIQKVLLEKEDR